MGHQLAFLSLFGLLVAFFHFLFVFIHNSCIVQLGARTHSVAGNIPAIGIGSEGRYPPAVKTYKFVVLTGPAVVVHSK